MYLGLISKVLLALGDRLQRLGVAGGLEYVVELLLKHQALLHGPVTMERIQ